MTATTDLLDMLPDGALGLGIGGLLVILGWELLRTLLLLCFVIHMSRAQAKRTGRYPTLGQATAALGDLLASSRLVPRLPGRRRPAGRTDHR